MDLYQYGVGNVATVRGGRRFCTVTWRGYLLLGPPGGWARVAVYRLDMGWDCYYADDVHSRGGPGKMGNKKP